MLRRTFLLLTLSVVANASLMQTIQEKNNVALTKDELIDLELQKNLKTFLDTYEKLKLIKVDSNYIKLKKEKDFKNILNETIPLLDITGDIVENSSINDILFKIVLTKEDPDYLKRFLTYGKISDVSLSNMKNPTESYKILTNHVRTNPDQIRDSLLDLETLDKLGLSKDMAIFLIYLNNRNYKALPIDSYVYYIKNEEKLKDVYFFKDNLMKFIDLHGKDKVIKKFKFYEDIGQMRKIKYGLRLEFEIETDNLNYLLSASGPLKIDMQKAFNQITKEDIEEKFLDTYKMDVKVLNIKEMVLTFSDNKFYKAYKKELFKKHLNPSK